MQRKEQIGFRAGHREALVVIAEEEVREQVRFGHIMRSISITLLAILIAGSSDAGTRFKFFVVTTANGASGKASGTVFIDGTSYRVDYDEGTWNTMSSVFSVDAGETETALNVELRTFFHPGITLSARESNRLLSMPMIPADSAGAPIVRKVSLREEPSDRIIEGHNVRKYSFELEYEMRMKIGSETIRGIFTSTATIWTADWLEPPASLPFDPRRVRTRSENVDAALEEALSAIEGFPLARELSVSRRIVGGIPFTEVVEVRFEDFEIVEPAPGAFEVPAGYRYQEPVYSFSGGS
jgi:hypothetical protein